MDIDLNCYYSQSVFIYKVSLIPAETRGQSGSMGSSGVSSGSGLDTQLRQCCREKEKRQTTEIVRAQLSNFATKHGNESTLR